MPPAPRLRLGLVLAIGGAVAMAGCSSSSPRVTSRPPARPSTRPTVASTTTSPAPVLRVAVASWGMPSPRSREVVVARAGGLEVLGGLDASRTSTASIVDIALPSGTATRAGTLARPAHDAAGAVIGGVPTVIGGGAATTVDAVQRAGAIVGRLPQPRSDLVAVTIGGTVYVLGGFDGTRGTPDVLATTDGVHFRAVARLPLDVRYPGVAVVGGGIDVLGGEHAGNVVATVQRVDVRAGAATIVGSLPQPIAHEAAFAFGDDVLLVGGRRAGRVLDTVQRYDGRGEVTDAGTLPYPVADAGSVKVGGTVYVLGGETPSATASVLLLTFGR